MTTGLWIALSIGIIAIIVLIVASVKLYNYEKKLHSQTKNYQDGRREKNY